MSGPDYNVARLSKLEGDLIAGQAAVRGILDAANDAADYARTTRAEALRRSVFEVPATIKLPELLGMLNAERERLGAPDGMRTGSRDESHARKVRQVQICIDAVRIAIDAAERAQGLQSQAAERNAGIASLQLLVKRCREWAGLNGAVIPVERRSQ